MMNPLKVYADWTTTVWAGDDGTLRSLAIVGLGLCGESQEVFMAAQALKHRPNGSNRKDLSDELGDVFYYWVRVCAIFKVDVSAAWATPRLARDEYTPVPAVQMMADACKIAEICKKIVRDDCAPSEVLSCAIADMAQSWRACCKHHGLDEQQIWLDNKNKLESRKQRNVIQGAGGHR